MIYRRAWMVTAATVGALGLAESAAAVDVSQAIAAALVGGATGGGAYVAFSPVEERAWPVALRPVLVSCGLGAATGAALCGLVALLSWFALLLVAAVVVTSPPVLGGAVRVAGRVERWLVPTGDATQGAKSSHSAASRPYTADLRILSNAELCQSWRDSSVELNRLGTHVNLGQRLALVTLRQHYLDEMDRRDPAGLTRWLSAGAGPGGDPSRYLGS